MWRPIMPPDGEEFRAKNTIIPQREYKWGSLDFKSCILLYSKSLLSMSLFLSLSEKLRPIGILPKPSSLVETEG